jgi:hypothetical protein
MSSEGMLQIRFSGQINLVKRIYERLTAKMPRGPRGGHLHRCGLKENSDGVTATLHVELPPELYANLFSDPSASSATAPMVSNALIINAEAVELDQSISSSPKYRIDYPHR